MRHAGLQAQIYELENVKVSSSKSCIVITTDKYVLQYYAGEKQCFIFNTPVAISSNIDRAIQAMRHEIMAQEDMAIIQMFCNIGNTVPGGPSMTWKPFTYDGELGRLDFEEVNDFLDYFVQHDNMDIKYANAFDINIKIENLLLL